MVRRSIRGIVGTFAVFLGLASSAPASAGVPVVIPPGTPVPVVVMEDLTSRDARPNEPVPVVAAQNVVVDGWVVIARGAPGVAEVLFDQQAQPGMQGGRLVLKTVWIRSVDHERIGIYGGTQAFGAPRTGLVYGGGIASAGALGAYSYGDWHTGNALATVGVLGAAVGVAQKGYEASVRSGTVIEAQVANPNGVEIEAFRRVYYDQDTEIK